MTTHDFVIANLDTDSISFAKKDGSPFTELEQKELLEELNSNFPDRIKWEHDGIYKIVIVLKAKNYILYDGDKIKTKGSSLKSSKTELGLKSFMQEIIECLVYDKKDAIVALYHKYIREIYNITDITRWASKKTITDAVLNGTRTTEKKILASLNGRPAQMGDKIYVYFANDQSLKLQEDWSNDHDTKILLKKLYNTLVIFKNVIKIEEYPKYHLKTNSKRLKEVIFEWKLFEVLNDD